MDLAENPIEFSLSLNLLLILINKVLYERLITFSVRAVLSFFFFIVANLFPLFSSLRNRFAGNICKPISYGYGSTSSSLLGTLYFNPCIGFGVSSSRTDYSLAWRWAGTIIQINSYFLIHRYFL